MTQSTFTFRVNEDLKDNFTALAKSLDRSGAQLLRDYMREMVHRRQEMEKYDAWFMREVKIGLDSANAGHLVSSDKVEAEFVARRANTRHRHDVQS